LRSAAWIKREMYFDVRVMRGSKGLKEAGEGWGFWSRVFLDMDVWARVLRGLGVYWMAAVG